MTIPFILLSPVSFAIHPKWNGLAFQCGDQLMPVLKYSENFSGCSDDLMALYEEVAGDSHPIDFAFWNGRKSKLVTRLKRVASPQYPTSALDALNATPNV